MAGNLFLNADINLFFVYYGKAIALMQAVSGRLLLQLQVL